MFFYGLVDGLRILYIIEKINNIIDSFELKQNKKLNIFEFVIFLANL